MLFFQALAFAASAAALSVTSPVEGSSISQADTLSITWATVASDSQTFDIELALSTDSGNQQTLTTNVSPSTNGYSTPASAFSPGNYTVNLVGDSQTSSGLLAQSKWFLITAAAVSSSARASSAAQASTIPAAAASAIASSASGAVASGGAAVAATTPTSSGAASSGSGSAAGSAAAASGSSASESGSSSSAASTTQASSTSSSEKIVASVAGLFMAGFAALLV